LLAAGDARAAITAYQRAIQLSPKLSGFRAALGRAYFQLGDTNRAIASYRAAVELDPNNGVARAALDRLGE
jgi:Flp pilus assembly protein TadD